MAMPVNATASASTCTAMPTRPSCEENGNMATKTISSAGTQRGTVRATNNAIAISSSPR